MGNTVMFRGFPVNRYRLAWRRFRRGLREAQYHLGVALLEVGRKLKG